MSAVELASRMQRGDLSAREVMEAHLEQIATVNPHVNAIVTLDEERAMAGAHAADDAHARGEALGLLHGLPVAHKDLMDTAGMRTTQGSPIYADNVPEVDALLVERYRAAGSILIGKTNTPEFGAGSQTFNEVFGVTRNPYDLSKTCGGSSGGAAVALATGMIPIADGSDFGGSLRNPAAFNNIVGMRPSIGRVPSWPKAAAWSTFSTDGALARSVADLALQMRAIVGYDPRSPIALETDPEIFADAARPHDGPLRVAWSRDIGGLPIEREITETLDALKPVMEGLGWEVVDAEPDLAEANEVFHTYRAWLYEISKGGEYDRHRDRLKPDIRWNVEVGREMPLRSLAGAAISYEAIHQRVRAFFEDFDLLACPVTQVAPFSVDVAWPAEVAGVEMENYLGWLRACTEITVTGCPTMSLPAGFTPGGLPVGIQLVAAHRADVTLLQMAAALEQATNHALHRPPVVS